MDPVAIHDFNSAIPLAVSTVLERALSTCPLNRFNNCSEFVKQLQCAFTSPAAVSIEQQVAVSAGHFAGTNSRWSDMFPARTVALALLASGVIAGALIVRPDTLLQGSLFFGRPPGPTTVA